MTTAALFLAMATLGVDVGYEPTQDGRMRYVVHIDVSTLNAMKAGQPIDALIPAEVRNLPPGRIRFVIDDAPVPKKKPPTTFNPSGSGNPHTAGVSVDGLGAATSASFAGTLGASDGSTGASYPLRAPGFDGGTGVAGTAPSLPGSSGAGQSNFPLSPPAMPVRSPVGASSGTAGTVPLVPAASNGGWNGGNPSAAPPNNVPYNNTLNNNNAPLGIVPMNGAASNGALLGGGPTNSGFGGAGPRPNDLGNNLPAGNGAGGPVVAAPPYLGASGSQAPPVFGSPSPQYNLTSGGFPVGSNPGGIGPSSNNSPPLGYVGNPLYTNPPNGNPVNNNVPYGPNAGYPNPVSSAQEPAADSSSQPAATSWFAQKPDGSPADNRMWIIYALAMGGLLFSNGYLAYMFWDARQRYHAMLGRAFAVSASTLGDPGS